MFRPRVPHVEQAAGWSGKYRRTGRPCRHFPGKLGKSLNSLNTSGLYSTYSDWGLKWKHEFTKWQSLTYLSDIRIFESTLFSCQRLVISIRLLLYVAAIITSINWIDPSLTCLIVQKFWVCWVLEATLESTWLECPLSLPTTSSTLTVLFHSAGMEYGAMLECFRTWSQGNVVIHLESF